MLDVSDEMLPRTQKRVISSRSTHVDRSLAHLIRWRRAGTKSDIDAYSRLSNDRRKLLWVISVFRRQVLLI